MINEVKVTFSSFGRKFYFLLPEDTGRFVTPVLYPSLRYMKLNVGNREIDPLYSISDIDEIELPQERLEILEHDCATILQWMTRLFMWNNKRVI